MVSIDGEYLVPDDIKIAYRAAVDLNKKGEYKLARVELAKLLEKYPEEPRLLNSLANTFARVQEDREQAVGYYDKALELAPNFAPALNNLSALYSALGLYEKAAKYARRAIKINPKSPVPWNTLGLYYVRNGDVEIGLGYFLASYTYDNGYYIAAFNAACAFTELGSIEEALDYLEKSLHDVRLYHDALKDPILDPLRGLSEFEAIINEAAERLVGSSRSDSAAE
jgi:tetratricopeptide (TPR) repeat protein